jgi:hypothetical protein
MTYDEGVLSEIALVEIQAKGGTAYQFASIIEEITPNEGDKDGESIVLVNGGRLWKRTPEGDFEITLKIYPIDTDQTASSDLSQGFANTDDNWDATEPYSDTNSRNREDFRVVILWTDDPGATTAGGATSAGYVARRLIFTQAYMTSYKESFDDKTVSAEVTFKGPAFNKSGTGNITRQSVKDGGANGLAALAAYS